MNQDNIDSWAKCVENELLNMAYPDEINDMYDNKIYDQQTATNTCYNKFPIKIVEGFGTSAWNIILVVIALLLLIGLSVYFFPNIIKKTPDMQTGGFLDISSVSPFQLQTINL